MKLSHPTRSGPKGQESIAQGLPWVSQKNILSPEGARDLECARSPMGAPSGLIPVGKLTQGKPWAMLSWPLRATDHAGSMLPFPLRDPRAMLSPSGRYRTKASL
jgi:hypothetical protein